MAPLQKSPMRTKEALEIPEEWVDSAWYTLHVRYERCACLRRLQFDYAKPVS